MHSTRTSLATAVALLLVATACGDGAGAGGRPVDARAVYRSACSACHGAIREGTAAAPGLGMGASATHGSEGIAAIIREGFDAPNEWPPMPAVNLRDSEIGAVAEWLTRGGG